MLLSSIFNGRTYSPLSTSGGSVIINCCFARSAVEDCVDILSAKPLGMCDCFYLFNAKKYKVEFYEKEREGKKAYSTHKLDGFRCLVCFYCLKVIS